MIPNPPSKHRYWAWCATTTLALSVAVLAAPEKTDKVYKWTDDKGVVHYGDAVPPQYADQDQTILNRQGVTVGSITGRRSAEQLAAEEASRKTETTAREEQKRRQMRDQNLLATYLSVAEIESLRDRRAEILDGQARVISQYLEQLETRAAQLEEQMRHFRPYAANPAAPALPQRIAEEVVRTITDVHSQQRALNAKREEADRTRAQFSEDITRFRELKSNSTNAPSPKDR
jgi:hypothetical protein